MNPKNSNCDKNSTTKIVKKAQKFKIKQNTKTKIATKQKF